jgi:hypothetical protein
VTAAKSIRGQPVLMQQTATSGFEPLYLSFGHLQG